MRPSFRGEVVDVTVESEYRGSVYERTVSVRTAEGVFDCFEGKSHVTANDIGDVVDIILLGRPTGLHVAKTVDLGIKQSDQPDDGQSRWRCTLCGEICDVDVSDEWLAGKYEPLPLLDVGVGSVLVESTDKLREGLSNGTIETGSNVRIDCSRLDIVGRNN